MAVQLIPADEFDKSAEMKKVAGDGKVREYLLEDEQGLTAVTIASNVRMTAGELRELCEKSDSPVAVQKKRSLKGLPDRMVVAILRQDRDEIAAGVKVESSEPKQAAESKAEKPDKPKPPAGK